MSTDFEECIAKILRNKSILEAADEKAVEVGVVLPLLHCVGWDTHDVSQVFPQSKVPEEGRSILTLGSMAGPECCSRPRGGVTGW